jgi:hypothetical protein
MIEIIAYELWYIHFMGLCWKPFFKFSYIGFANVMRLLEANINHCSDWNIFLHLLNWQKIEPIKHYVAAHVVIKINHIPNNHMYK